MIARLLLLALLCVAGPAAAQKRIAFSFDDVPRQSGAFFSEDERTERLIAMLREGNIEQAGFFVTTGNLERTHGGAERIAAYVNAGHVIGNHSHSHLWASRTALEAYLADLDKAEAWLKGRPGRRPWYRFPFLDEAGRDKIKRDGLRAALHQRGLANAYVTIDNYDWFLDGLANAAKREGRAMDMAALRDLYVETLVDTANFYERMAAETMGRSPVHVLLLHETDLAALCVADLARALRADGWRIVSIDEAYRDPIAAVEPDTWFLGEGRVAAFAQLAGRSPDSLVHERTDEEALTRLFDERVLSPSADASKGSR